MRFIETHKTGIVKGKDKTVKREDLIEVLATIAPRIVVIEERAVAPQNRDAAKKTKFFGHSCIKKRYSGTIIAVITINNKKLNF